MSTDDTPTPAPDVETSNLERVSRNKVFLTGELISMIEERSGHLYFRIITQDGRTAPKVEHDIQTDIRWKPLLGHTRLGDTLEIHGSFTATKRVLASRIWNVTSAEKSKPKGGYAGVVLKQARQD